MFSAATNPFMPNDTAAFDPAKYDRSLRLWGSQGQTRLAQAHVVLLGASATGSEALKNLILPGLGKFTVVDDAAVTIRDLGCNFFLEQSDIGKSRGAAVVRTLLELNPSASGHAIERSPVDLIRAAAGPPHEAARPAALPHQDDLQQLQATLIIVASTVPHGDILLLASRCRELQIPLLFAESVGLFGVLRVQAQEQCIIHTHPDPDMVVYDVPIVDPFPELKAWYDTHDPHDVAKFHDTHSHIPWPCVLYHAIQRVRRESGQVDFAPVDAAGWKLVKAAIVSMTKVDEASGLKKEENMLEAQAKCNKSVFASNRVKPLLNAALSDVRALQPSKTDDDFWFVVHGVVHFRNKHGGSLPQPGHLPDFRSGTHWYRELQELFKKKAFDDASEVFTHVQRALRDAGRNEHDIHLGFVEEFCANVYEAATVSFAQIDDEYHPNGLSRPLKLYTNQPDSFLIWYAVHRAARLFREKYGRPPGGVDSSDHAADAAVLRQILNDNDPQTVLSRPADDINDVVHEFARYGGGELCSTASIVGAVVAQEAIKLIQKRRVPLKDAIVFDGNLGVFGTVVIS